MSYEDLSSIKIFKIYEINKILLKKLVKNKKKLKDTDISLYLLKIIP